MKFSRIAPGVALLVLALLAVAGHVLGVAAVVVDLGPLLGQEQALLGLRTLPR